MNIVAVFLLGLSIGLWVGRVVTRIACEQEKQFILRCERVSAKLAASADEQVLS